MKNITNIIINSLNKYLDTKIDSTLLITENYTLYKDELDSSLLPNNFSNLADKNTYLVHFCYYKNLTIYLIENINNNHHLLGIIKNDTNLVRSELIYG